MTETIITQTALDKKRWSYMTMNPGSPEYSWRRYSKRIHRQRQAPLYLEVDFEPYRNKERDYGVWLVAGKYASTRIYLWNITTIEQLLDLYKLLKGN